MTDMSEPDPAAVPHVASPNLSTAAMSVQPDPDRVIPRKQVVSWAMWDWATQPFNSVLLTFVFVPLYLVSANFLPADVAAQNADDTLVCNRRRGCGDRVLRRPRRPGGVVRLGDVPRRHPDPACSRPCSASAPTSRATRSAGWSARPPCWRSSSSRSSSPTPTRRSSGSARWRSRSGAVTSEIAGVNYNAMLVEVSTPRTVGRVSGLGWGLGYIGGILALVLVVVLNQVEWFGLDTSDGLAYRLIAVGCAVWTVVFAIPFVLNVPEATARTDREKIGFFASYGRLVPRHRGALPQPPPDVLVPHRERGVPRRARRRLRVRRRPRRRRVRLQRHRGHHLRHRPQPRRRRLDDHRRAARRPVRRARRHRHGAVDPHRELPVRLLLPRAGQDDLLDRRHHPVGRRRAGAGIEPIAAGARDPARDAGRDLRPLRDDRARDELPLAAAVGALHRAGSARPTGASSASRSCWRSACSCSCS